MAPCYAIVHSDLRVTGCPGETGWAGGADHDPLDGAGDGLHGVAGESAQQLRPPEVRVARLTSDQHTAYLVYSYWHRVGDCLPAENWPELFLFINF